MLVLSNEMNKLLYLSPYCALGLSAAVQRAGVPLHVLEDRLFRVVNWEDQTKEDLAQKFLREERRLPISLLRRQKTRFI